MKYSIVTAVFRSEIYLDQYLNSLVSQTIGFAASIQLVMVDDGSDDGSAAIALAWAQRFPHNITYLRQENRGVASARNAGLAHARGSWVTFCDADDVLSPTYFEQIDAALADTESEPCALIACRVVSFRPGRQPMTGALTDDGQFAPGAQICDLDNAAPPPLPLAAASSLFRLDRIRAAGLCFRDIRPRFEDVDFVARYLLAQSRRTVLSVPQAHYFHRKNPHRSWRDDSSLRDARSYSVLPQDGYLRLLQDARQSQGHVPVWIQRMVIGSVSAQIGLFIDNPKASVLIPAEQREEYCALLRSVFAHIDDTVIGECDPATVPLLSKLAMLGLLKGQVQGASSAEIVAIDRKRHWLGLSLLYAGPRPELQFFKAAQAVVPEHRKTRLHHFLDRECAREEIVWLAWRSAGQLSLQVYGKAVPIRSPAQSIGDGAIMIPELHRLTPRVDPARISPRDLTLRQLAAKDTVSRKFHQAWLLMDREEEADDNAEHLYRHILHAGMPVNAWFVLNRQSSDWPRLLAEGFRLIEFGSVEHALALLNAEHVVSSHIGPKIPNFLPTEPFQDRLTFAFTYLRHGVSEKDSSAFLNGFPIDAIVTAAESEATAIAGDVNAYKFSRREVPVVTGFPRHDRLLERQSTRPDCILFIPTWRQHLVQPDAARSLAQQQEAFLASTYFLAWRSLIEHDTIAEAARAAGLRLAFYPHPMFSRFAERIEFRGVEVLSKRTIDSFQAMLARSAFLVTDYSSIAFEMGYMLRPSVYYQFDEASFFAGEHTMKKGYFDYRRDGFGPVCTDADSAAGEIVRLAGRLGRAEPHYRDRMQHFFAHRDGNCCERVFQLICGMGGRV